MLRFITPVDAAIFTGLLGIVLILTGREVGGAIVIAASLGAFVFFEWYLYGRKTGIDYSTNRGIRKHNAMYPDDPIPLIAKEDEPSLPERLLRIIGLR
ncbi:hypothetical protein [Rhizobium arsenicireducens]